MRITVMGSGYVGLVAATCFAKLSHHVTAYDVDGDKIVALSQGISPIYEPGLEDLLHKGRRSARLTFTDNPQQALEGSDIVFIAVGTPMGESGAADLQYVLEAARTIGLYINQDVLVVNKSTVPVYTSEKVHQQIRAALASRGADFDVDVASNPEFLREGSAIADFLNPDRVVVGTNSSKAANVLRSVYAEVCPLERIQVMSPRSAELCKYAANAMLATKISFINEVANIAETVGANVSDICKGISLDKRIGPYFISPGCGYGGSCFPKDVKALIAMAHQADYPAELLSAVEAVNATQKFRPVAMLQTHYQHQLKGKHIALWGLAFKPNTDDMRESPALVVIRALQEAGAGLSVYDPKATAQLARYHDNMAQIRLCDSAEGALEGAHALVVLTEWGSFLNVSPTLIAQKLTDKVLIDARNMFSPDKMRAANIVYYGIGLGE